MKIRLLQALSFRVSFGCLGAVIAFAGLPLTASAQLSVEVTRQIQSLAEEKRARTPAQKKIDSQLLYAIKMDRGEAISNLVPTLSVDVGASGGRVTVDIAGTISPALLEFLKANGALLISSLPGSHSARVEIALNRLETIAIREDVRGIMSAQGADRRVMDGVSGEKLVREQLSKALGRGSPNGPELAPGQYGHPAQAGIAHSEGDRTHRADTARGVFNTDGAGVKIGVLADGAVNIEAAQDSGDLPEDVVILPGQAGSGDQGTALLEIIHDLAPGAQLFFATGSGGVSGLATNIKQLRNAGCDIIVDGVEYQVESPFQDGQAPSVVSNTNGGIVTQAVNEVTADGALYFSLAGDNGNLNDNRSSVYEGDFVNAGTLAIIGGAGAGPVHDFDPTAAVSQYDRVTTGSGEPVAIFWSDPLGASANDYDLYVLNAAGTALVAASTGAQDGTQDPFELVGGGANVTDNRIVIAKFSGADRYLHLNAGRGRLEFKTSGRIKGHAMAADAFCVAATAARTANGGAAGPFPDPFSGTNTVEPYSADGPRRIFFQANGTPITPGNFSSTGGLVRQKPDFTAADGVDISGAGGIPRPIFGTPVAAAHAAAIAALIKAANPALTSAQIRTALTSSAVDIETAGTDRDSGSGIVMAYQALQAAGIPPAANLGFGIILATEAGGNGNGVVESGEQGTLSIELTNVDGGAAATAISATLTSQTPGVSVGLPGTSSYADVAPGATATNSTPFTFAVSGDLECPATVTFTLTVSYSGGASPRSLDFTLSLSQFRTINETLDAVAPPNGASYTAATGLQTGRLVRTSDASRCGTIKANPGINGADQTVPHRFDAYTFQNSSGSSICVTVTLTTASGAPAGVLQSVAYAPTFNLLVPNQNYLGDIGPNGPPSRTYSFDVAANTDFVVVVSEVSGGGGLGTAYTLEVGGLPCAVSPSANQGPVNTVPGPQTVAKNGQLVFSGPNLNQISIADPDANGFPVEVTITANNGTFKLTTTAGLTFSTGDGTDDPTMTFRGTIAGTNSALNGAIFKPGNGFAGSASVTLQTSDQGNVGAGGPLVDNDTISINVTDPAAFPAKSLNISSRARVETGNRVLIAGSIINGSEEKRVLIRGMGPSLPPAAGALLADPVLELRGANGALLASNNDWRDTQEGDIQATGLAPTNDLESAIIQPINPGSFTAILRGNNNTSGVGLVEIYDLNPTVDAELANISTRAFIQTGNNILIGGFILGGEGPNSDVIVRALGPSLAGQVGADPVLADPTLELRDRNGVLLRANDDWQEDAAQQAQISAAGLAPTNPKESAISASLPPGAFTAIVAGKNGGIGMGLVEIYNH